MKPYPASLSEQEYMALWRRRAAALSTEEPRDDSVPAELQDEDRPLPMPWTGAVLGVATVTVVILTMAVYFGLPSLR